MAQYKNALAKAVSVGRGNPMINTSAKVAHAAIFLRKIWLFRYGGLDRAPPRVADSLCCRFSTPVQSATHTVESMCVRLKTKHRKLP